MRCIVQGGGQLTVARDSLIALENRPLTLLFVPGVEVGSLRGVFMFSALALLVVSRRCPRVDEDSLAQTVVPAGRYTMNML